MLATKEVLTRNVPTEHRCHEHHLRYLQADFPLDLSRASVRPPPSPRLPGSPFAEERLTDMAALARLTLHAVNKHNATLPQCFPDFKPAEAK